MAIKIIINEPSIGLTDQTGRLSYNSSAQLFDLIKGQRGTAAIPFQIQIDDSYQSSSGSPVYIHEVVDAVDHIVWAGKILTVERTWNGNLGCHLDILTCVSLEACFDDIIFTGTYPASKGGAMFAAVFNDHGGGIPVTLGSVDMTLGPVLPQQVFYNTKLSDVLFTTIPTLMGLSSNAIAGVQMSDSTLYLHAQSTVPAPFTLEKVRFETGDWKIDQTEFRNRQLVQIAFTAFSTSNQMFDGDGVTQEFFLPVPVDRVVSAMLTTSTQATAVGQFGLATSPFLPLNPAPGDTFTITSDQAVVEDPYTFVSSLDNTLRNQILIGVDAAETCLNTVDAINANPATAGIKYSLPTWENDCCNADAPIPTSPIDARFTLRVRNPGSGGNGVALTVTHVTSPGAFHWQSAATAGGSDGQNNALNVGVAAANSLSTDVQYTPGTNRITTAAVIAGGLSLSVAYYRFGGDTIALENTASVIARAAAEHGSGKYQQIITDTQCTDARAGYIEALQALIAYNVIPATFQFDLDQALLSTGQLLTISVTAPTGASTVLDGTWLVQEVRASLVPGMEKLPEPYGHLRYTVIVINTLQIGTVPEFWANLAKVSPVGSQTVNNTNIQISTPSLSATVPTDTTPSGVPTQGTPTATAAGNQWVQEAPGRYAQQKANDLQTDGADDTIVFASSYSFQAGDVGKSVIVILGTGWTPGEYTIASVSGGQAKLGSSPAPTSSTGGVWALVSNDLWCTTWNQAPSYTNDPVMVLGLNGALLNTFALGVVGYIPRGGGDYVLQKGNQILLGSPIDPNTDRLVATYFPAGITQAPVGPQTTKVAVFLDLVATDVPQPYTPTVPPGGDRHFWDLQVNGFFQDVKATLSEVGTTDAAIIWSLVSSDGHTTDPSVIGALLPSGEGSIYRTFASPTILPSTRTPPVPDTVVLGVQSHADATVTAFNTITLTGTPPPPSSFLVAIGQGNTGSQIMTSSDAGVSWTSQSSGVDPDGGLCIATMGSVVCAANFISGTGSTVAVTSTDHGVTWTTNAITLNLNQEFLDLIVVSSLFIALGSDYSGFAFGAYTSPDGATWTPKVPYPTGGGVGNGFNGGLAIAFGAGTYVVVGDASNALTGTDLNVWTLSGAMPSPSAGSSVWQDIAFGSGVFVSVGVASPGSGSLPIARSADGGSTWTAPSSTLPTSGFGWAGVAFGGGVWCAVANDGLAVTSSDGGVTWAGSIVAALATGFATQLRYVDGMFVCCLAVNSVPFGTIATSPDGVTWTVQTTSFDFEVADVTVG